MRHGSRAESTAPHVDNPMVKVILGVQGVTPQWRRVRNAIRRREHISNLVNLREGIYTGANHVINYMNGYIAASKGKDKLDQSGAVMESSVTYPMWYRRGWEDYSANLPPDPFKMVREKAWEGDR